MNHYFQIRALASAVEKAKILKSYKQRDTFPQVSVVGCLKKKSTTSTMPRVLTGPVDFAIIFAEGDSGPQALITCDFRPV